jgi:hypothetical protein
MLAMLLAAALSTQPVVTETIVLDELPCGREVTSIWDWPTCDDYQLDTSLETAAKQRDHSAIDLLEKRYETADTLREKRRIASMLLNRVPDDSKYWKPLFALAEDCLRFAGDDEEAHARLKAFADERGIDPNEYETAAEDAFLIIAYDIRSRPLLLRALDSDVPILQAYAIVGFAAQRDESMLERIESVIAKATKERDFMAAALMDYRSEAADKIALKYLPEDQRADYVEARQRLDDPAQTDR